MQVYLVWETHHDYVHSRNVLKGIFLDRQKAEARLDVLNQANTNPLVQDSYGPISGVSYSVFENEVEE